MNSVSSPASAPSRESGIWLAGWLVFVLILCGQSNALVRMPFNLLVDPMRASFALSDTQFSLLQGFGITVPLLLASPLWGLASDRFSRHRLLAAAMAMMCGAAIGLALSTSFPQLLLWRAVVGIGSAALFPIAVTLITDRFEPSLHGRALGLFYAGIGLSPGLAAFGTGMLYELAGSMPAKGLAVALAPWQLTFAFCATLPLVCAGLLLTYKGRRRAQPAGDDGAKPAGPSAVPRNPLGISVLVVILAALALLSMLDEANLSWLATVYTRYHGFTQRQAGDVLGLIALAGGGAGPAVGGWLADRLYARHGVLGRVALCLVACTCSTPLLLAYLQGQTWLLTVALGGSAFFLTATLTCGMVVMQQALPAHIKGLGTGLMYSAIVFVAGGGPTLVALVTDRVYADPQSLPQSVATVTVALGVLACLCWIVALVLVLRKPSKP